MAKLTKNTNFFKEHAADVASIETKAAAQPVTQQPPVIQPTPPEQPKTPTQAASAPKPQAQPPQQPQIAPASPIHISASTKELIHRVNGFLDKINQPRAKEQVEKTLQTVKKELFSVAVVGEFSTGKSSLINRILEKPVLPVSTLPTTSMLTRIRPYAKDSMIYIAPNGTRTVLPLVPESWDKLVIQNLDEQEIRGMVMVGLDSLFLKQAGIEIIDTPGANDLSAQRARIVGDALVGADGAIITVSATKALSQSEKLFVQQRLITQHTPFMMLALTRLDLVPLAERNTVVTYVKKSLDMWQKEWNVQIPLYIAGHVELPDDTYQNINGDDKILQLLLNWRNDPKRVALTERWLINRVGGVLELASMPLKEQKALMEANDEKRRQALSEKKAQLSSTKLNWDKIMLQLEQRCTDCYDAVLNKADTLQDSIVEELVFNASNSPKPNRWWDETYPYLLKTRLASMSASLENIAISHINNDVHWLNATLEKQFRSSILASVTPISEANDFDRTLQSRSVETKDIDKMRTKSRITTTCLTLAGTLVCMATGTLPMLATMGIGSGASIISERMINKKRDAQIAEIVEAVKENIPVIIHAAMAQTRQRITQFYRDIQREALEKQDLWFATQQELLEKSAQTATSEERTNLNALLVELDALNALLEKYAG